MFKNEDFNIFAVESLEERMQLIRGKLGPKFEQSAAVMLPVLNENGQQWYAHVAKHLRRTTNAPDNTWVAFAPNKRGYKMMPHFELGIWADHVYLYLAVEENMKPKDTQSIVTKMTAARDLVQSLPSDFVLSPDHMVNASQQLTIQAYDDMVARYRQVKHSEVLIGINILRGDQSFVQDTDLSQIITALKLLLPIYDVLK
ncbi:DUF1054 family protein [Leuconostoc rapi]|uniref:DUF1054 family protein n=1 Tax=Leuconostoc rapi TaxID=1406906 RepID=UPI0019576479|nr:DUF1054 family protein [Leuconostoc rapi]MBM7435382.1 uncharacterized protein YktB (UPF0637 family) [Leuconostoc rapi]